jgi:GAF domain-containing protein
MNPHVQEALERLDALGDVSIQEYRDAITKELCWLTDSPISYFAAMNLTEDVLTMIGWSRTAMGMCQTIDKPLIYRLEETGLWGDAVREGTTVITNDYSALDKPTKKGYPAGHIEIERHMNLPIFEGERIAVVVGVGNKATDYTLDDAALVQELMDSIWESFQEVLWAETFN